MDLGWRQKLDWRLAGGAALLVAGAVIMIAWAWQVLSSGPSSATVAATSVPRSRLRRSANTSAHACGSGEAARAASAKRSQVPKAGRSQPPAASSIGWAARDLQASELTWVSTRDATGNAQMLARVFEKGNTQSVDLPNGATVRVGNAGGLSILLNGASIGPLGNHGQVREVVFRNGSYKIIAAIKRGSRCTPALPRALKRHPDFRHQRPGLQEVRPC